MTQNRIVPYFLDSKSRDTFLIFPGGAYQRTSPREATPVARRVNQIKKHAAVYEYRRELIRYPEILDDAIEQISGFMKDSRIRRLFLMGFSAGGHLALLVMETQPAWFRGGILAYPVVTGKADFCHAPSINNLLGDDCSNERREEISLEDHVPDNCPPMFLFHTVDDGVVPIENSLFLIQSLRRKNIPVEAHLYPHGQHGVSLADESTAFTDKNPKEFAKENQHLSGWFDLMIAWLDTIQ